MHFAWTHQHDLLLLIRGVMPSAVARQVVEETGGQSARPFLDHQLFTGENHVREVQVRVHVVETARVEAFREAVDAGERGERHRGFVGVVSCCGLNSAFASDIVAFEWRLMV
jgi:hypothetical protein